MSETAANFLYFHDCRGKIGGGNECLARSLKELDALFLRWICDCISVVSLLCSYVICFVPRSNSIYKVQHEVSEG